MNTNFWKMMATVLLLLSCVGSTFAQEFDPRADLIRVSETLEPLGFSLERNDMVTVREDFGEPEFRRMRWWSNSFAGREYVEIIVQVSLGYFEDDLELASALNSLRRHLNMDQSTSPEEDVDVIFSRRKRMVFTKNHFVIGIGVSALPVSKGPDDAGRSIAAALKRDLVQQIERSNQPKLEPFKAEFRKEETDTTYIIHATLDGGIAPEYRYGITQPNEESGMTILLDSNWIPLNEHEYTVTVDKNLPSGTYDFGLIIRDRLYRSEIYEDQIVIQSGPCPLGRLGGRQREELWLQEARRRRGKRIRNDLVQPHRREYQQRFCEQREFLEWCSPSHTTRNRALGHRHESHLRHSRVRRHRRCSQRSRQLAHPKRPREPRLSDLVPLERASLGFQYEASKGRLLYCRDSELLASWREQTWRHYLDLQPRFRQQARDLLTS
jgi:hypothetical protein